MVRFSRTPAVLAAVVAISLTSACGGDTTQSEGNGPASAVSFARQTVVPQYSFDLRDRKRLSAESTDILAGVVDSAETFERYGTLWTKYAVTKKVALKGNLPERITVEQQGGIDTAARRVTAVKGDTPLVVSVYYLLYTIKKSDGVYTLIAGPGHSSLSDCNPMQATLVGACGVLDQGRAALN